jgi:hypothetical protein
VSVNVAGTHNIQRLVYLKVIGAQFIPEVSTNPQTALLNAISKQSFSFRSAETFSRAHIGYYQLPE